MESTKCVYLCCCPFWIYSYEKLFGKQLSILRIWKIFWNCIFSWKSHSLKGLPCLVQKSNTEEKLSKFSENYNFQEVFFKRKFSQVVGGGIPSFLTI